MTRRRDHRPDDLLPDDLLGDSPLGRVLQDASGPATASELAGLSAAVAAFTALPTASRRSRMPSLLARLLALKVLLAGVAVASLGGVSLAAATGSLPGPAQNAAHQLVGAPAAHSDADSDSDTADQGAKDEADASARPEATPSPSLVGLCRAYGAGVASANGKALDNPAFTVLITAAGGKDGVSAFCTTLLATAPGGKPTARPTQAQGHPPTAHPSHAPRPHATGASKDQRSTPAPHPTKRP